MPARTEFLHTYSGLGLATLVLVLFVSALYGTAHGVMAVRQSLAPVVTVNREVRVVNASDLPKDTADISEEALREDAERDRESTYTELVAPFYENGRLVRILHADTASQREGEKTVRLENFVLWEFSEDGLSARRLRADVGRYDRDTGALEAKGNVRARKYTLAEEPPPPDRDR